MAFYRMEPAGAERHRREAREGKRAGASESNAIQRYPRYLWLSLCCAIQRISVISRLRLGTSSLRKTAWRCFFTIGKLKQASSAIS
jgi:hypothetical protein